MGRRTKVTRQDTADFGLKSESLTSSPLFLPVSRGELGEVSTKEADLRRRGPRGLSHEAALQRRAARRTQGSRALERPLAPPARPAPSKPRPQGRSPRLRRDAPGRAAGARPSAGGVRGVPRPQVRPARGGALLPAPRPPPSAPALPVLQRRGRARAAALSDTAPS